MFMDEPIITARLPLAGFGPFEGSNRWRAFLELLHMVVSPEAKGP
jgi:hypothetical protein